MQGNVILNANGQWKMSDVCCVMLIVDEHDVDDME